MDRDAKSEGRALVGGGWGSQSQGCPHPGCSSSRSGSRHWDPRALNDSEPRCMTRLASRALTGLGHRRTPRNAPGPQILIFSQALQALQPPLHG